ncbi:MAG: isocitrate lyase/phosphoenolpyruvate mutase family protein [Sphingomonas sp.]
MPRAWWGAVDLPVTIDFEGGYAVEPESPGREHGAACGDGSGGAAISRIRWSAAKGCTPCRSRPRASAAARGDGGARFPSSTPRTDIFLKQRTGHDEAMVDAALDRAHAYAEAGASGFFVPLL